MAKWLSRGGNTSSRDEAAGEEAGRQATRYGKVHDQLKSMGHLKAANNVQKNAGRADSPEELTDGEVRRGQARGNGGGGLSRS
jgi:hypothetical protein